LIDTAKGFCPVYAVYRHEYLGCLISAHVVQELPNGRMSLLYQALHPDNMAQFGEKLDDNDRKLVHVLSELSNQSILKVFAPRLKYPRDFFQKLFKDEIQKVVQNYVNTRMAQAMELLAGKALYIMANDGYPAQKPVRILSEKASIRFHFDRRDQGTLYYPKIFLGGKEIRFKDRFSEVLCDDPAWVIVDQEVFTFDHAVDGRKLAPFLKKGSLVIRPEMEDKFFQGFGKKLIEQYEVRTDGMVILPVKVKPHFWLHVDSNGNNFRMEFLVRYADHDFPPSASKAVEVKMDARGLDFPLYKIMRDSAKEAAKIRLLESLLPNRNLDAIHFFGKQEGLAWLSEHVTKLQEAQVEVVQTGGDKPINFEAPTIVLEPQDSGDWFDIKAVVHIGGHEIPFFKFKNHILKGRRDFVLPDGSVVILPESWFTDYRHLVEIAEEREGDIIAIKKYQAVVLDMPNGGAHPLKAKLAALMGSGVEEIPVPTGLQAELRAYQKKGYEWLGFLRASSFGGILADDMGLGKTLQAISLLLREKELGNTAPSLIVMPTSLIYNWVSEAAKFAPSLRIMVHIGLHRARHVYSFQGYDLVLTTYGTVRQDLDMFRDFAWHYLILDESQMIKNPASKTSKAVCELNPTHRLSLTGTPLENTLMDLWSQMNFLNPGLLGSERFFRDFYATPIERDGDIERREQLRRLIHPFILRRTKEQVAHELPAKVETMHPCEMTDDQRAYYEKTKNAYRNFLLGMEVEEFNKKKLNILAGLQKLRQIAIHPALVEDEEQDTRLLGSGKYEEFGRLLEEVVSKGAKVLVFSQFVRVLSMLRTDLDEKGVRYCYLDGSTRDRQAQVERFQNDPSVTAFLISLKAGGVGLNLTAAEYVFILDPWWNPAVEAQAIDRSHRIGQKKTVFSYKFITRDSIEEKIVRLQERKAQLSNEIVSVEDDIFKQLNLADLQELLA
jgi:hypothetical protein